MLSAIVVHNKMYIAVKLDFFFKHYSLTQLSLQTIAIETNFTHLNMHYAVI